MNDSTTIAVPETRIAEYSPTAAGLAELRSRLANVVYDVTTASGMDKARKDRRECVSLRTALEAKRVELKAPALERSRLIDAEAKALTVAIAQLEEPIDAQIRAEEDRKAAEKVKREQAERERVAAINQRIDWIRGQALAVVGKPAAGIRAALETLARIPLDAEHYAEFLDTARDAVTAAADKLTQMLGSAEWNEKEAARLKAEREAFERQRAEQEAAAAAERARLAEEERAAKAKRDAEAAVERKRLDDEARVAREAREAADAKAKAERDEQDRIAREARIAAESAAAAARAEQDRVAREQREREEEAARLARKAEQDRLDAQVAEQARQAAEIERQRVAAATAHVREVEATLASMRADPRVVAFVDLATAYKLAAPGTPTLEALTALCKVYAKALPRVRVAA